MSPRSDSPLVCPADVPPQVHLFGYGSYMKDFEQITLIQRVLDFVGGDNMFRRYSFEDGKWLLVQGYSLTLFEEPLVVEDLALMVRLPSPRLVHSC